MSKQRMAGLIEAVERRPRIVLAVFLVVHALVWTALPALLYFNLPLDVIEAMTYGREWQLGYDQLAALLIIDGMHYFNLSAVKFNHNVIEMPLWALAGFAFHAALRAGKLRHWF